MKAGLTTTSQPTAVDESEAVRQRVDHRALGHRLPDGADQVSEAAAILGRAHRGQGRAQDPDLVSVQHPGVVEADRQVEAGLSAQGRQERVGAVLGDDPFEVLDRQRTDDHGPAHVRIGHDRGRIRVHEDRFDAFAPQREAGLDSGVVELGRLTDDDGPRTDDQDAARVHGSVAGRAGEAGTQEGRVEEAGRVGRTRSALGVELDRCHPAPDVDQPFDRAVVQVTVAHPDAGRGKGRVVHDLDLVVVRADGHPSGGCLDDSVVAAVVADREATSRRAGSEAQELVPQADAEERRSTGCGSGNQVRDGRDLARHVGRVARAR